MSGPCLSSSVAGRPLRPATRQCLGEPLPRQLADRPRAHRKAPGCPGFSVATTCGINSPFGELSPTSRQIAHVLRTLAPLGIICIATNNTPLDLHVLSTPPAFVLSQNQTLREKRMRQLSLKVCVEQLLRLPTKSDCSYLLITSIPKDRQLSQGLFSLNNF